MPYIAREAARHINDDESVPEALPDLASTLWIIQRSLHRSPWAADRAISACTYRQRSRPAITTSLNLTKRLRMENPAIEAGIYRHAGSTWAHPLVLGSCRMVAIAAR